MVFPLFFNNSLNLLKKLSKSWISSCVIYLGQKRGRGGGEEGRRVSYGESNKILFKKMEKEIQRKKERKKEKKKTFKSHNAFLIKIFNKVPIFPTIGTTKGVLFGNDNNR